jgi:dipeptidase
MPTNYPPEIGSRGWIAMGPSEFALWQPTYGLVTDTHPYFQTETESFENHPESA